MVRKRDRRRRSRKQQGISPNIWLATFAIALSAASILGLRFFNALDQFDPETGCIAGTSPTQHTVFLVDRSDDFSDRQIDDLREVLVRTFQELEVNELLSIYSIGGDVPSIPKALAQFCRPPLRSGEANVQSTDGFLARRYKKFFAENVDPILDKLTTPLSSEESPLLEWIVAISETRDFASNNLENRRMVIFSDMVHYVPQEGFQYCTVFPSFDSFQRDRYFSRVSADLSGVRITIFNVRRITGGPCVVGPQRNMRALENFWFDYFDYAGARMSPRRFTRIGE